MLFKAFPWYSTSVIFLAILLMLLPAEGLAFEVLGLSTPESFIVDPATGNYFISNINGAPTDRDNNGFITKLDRAGKVVAMEFIRASAKNPLHAPKGMAVVGGSLWVTDIDHVKTYDTGSGAPVADLDLTSFGVAFLNDIAADGAGNIFVSDMQANKIFKIDTKERKVSTFAEGEKLGQPNGLVVDPKSGRLIMVSWGLGQVVEIDPNGQMKPLSEKTFKNLDGVDFSAGGDLYFSSFTRGEIYRLKPGGAVETFKSGLTTPADINIDRKNNLLLIPLFEGNSAATLKIP